MIHKMSTIPNDAILSVLHSHMDIEARVISYDPDLSFPSILERPVIDSTSCCARGLWLETSPPPKMPP
jgi:hypothetical protein